MKFDPSARLLIHTLRFNTPIEGIPESGGTPEDILRDTNDDRAAANWLARLFTARGFEARISTKLDDAKEPQIVYGLQVFLPGFGKHVLLSVPKVQKNAEYFSLIRKLTGEETSLFYPPVIAFVGEGPHSQVVHSMERYRQETIHSHDFGNIFGIEEKPYATTQGWALFNVRGEELIRVRDGSPNLDRKDLTQCSLRITNKTVLYPSYSGNSLARVKAILDVQAKARSQQAHDEQRTRDAEAIAIQTTETQPSMMASGAVVTHVPETRAFVREATPKPIVPSATAAKAFAERLNARKKPLPSEQFRGSLTQLKDLAKVSVSTDATGQLQVNPTQKTEEGTEKVEVDLSDVVSKTSPEALDAANKAIDAVIESRTQAVIEGELSPVMRDGTLGTVDVIAPQASTDKPEIIHNVRCAIAPTEVLLGSQSAILLGEIQVDEFPQPGEIIRLAESDAALSATYDVVSSVIRKMDVVYDSTPHVKDEMITLTFLLREGELFAVISNKGTNPQPDTRRSEDGQCQGTE